MSAPIIQRIKKIIAKEVIILVCTVTIIFLVIGALDLYYDLNFEKYSEEVTWYSLNGNTTERNTFSREIQYYQSNVPDVIGTVVYPIRYGLLVILWAFKTVKEPSTNKKKSFV